MAIIIIINLEGGEDVGRNLLPKEPHLRGGEK
jgi:hypothetical protein